MKNFKNIMRYIGKTSKFIDYPLLVTYVILCLIGLVMVYSASMVAATKGTLTGGAEVSGTYFYTRQLLYVIMSFAIVFYGIYHECKGPETTQCPKMDDDRYICFTLNYVSYW